MGEGDRRLRDAGDENERSEPRVRIWPTVASGVRVYRSEWRLLLPIAALLLVPDALGWATSAIREHLGGPFSDDHLHFGQSPIKVIVGLAFTIVHVLVWIIAVAIAFAATSVVVDGPARSSSRWGIRRTASSIRPRLLGLLKTVVPVGIVLSVLSVASRLVVLAAEPDLRSFEGAGDPFGTSYYAVVIPTFLLGMVAALAVYTTCFFAAHAVQHEGLQGVAALRRSRRLVAGSSWRVAGLLFGVGVALNLVGMLPTWYLIAFDPEVISGERLPLSRSLSLLGDAVSAMLTSLAAVCAAVGYWHLTGRRALR